jgi:hypothetical protein
MPEVYKPPKLPPVPRKKWPPVPRKPPPVPRLTAEELRWRRYEERWKEFEDPLMWFPSKKGNEYRDWDGKRVIVLRSRSHPGRWQWCVTYGKGARFSYDTYETLEDARTALGHFLAVDLT